MPELRDGSPDPAGVGVSSAGSGEFFVLFEKDYVRVSVQAPLFPAGQPFVFGLVYGHTFDL